MIIKEGESSPLSIRSVLGIGVLKIINQTSATTLSDIKYVATIINEPLKMNAVLELEQVNTVEDYLEFLLLKTKAVGTWKVRTKDKVSVAKGEEKTFTLTDDTEVVIILKSGVSEPTKIRNVLNIAKLRFFNETSTVLKNIQYEGASGKVDNLNIHGGNEWFFWDYDSTSKHFIFEVQTSDGPVKVKTKESISLFAGKIVTYTSNNDTVVLKDGTNEEVQIKHLLGVRTLNVLNRTTATSLKSLKLINEIREEELENNETWTIDFNSEVNDYLEFELLRTKEIGAWRVRTKEKINIPKGQVKDFTLTDDTEVVIVSISGVSEATKISSVLGITELQFFNKTSVVLKNIQYEGESSKVDHLNINEGDGWYFWDYDATPKRFIFEVQTSDGPVKVRTKDKVTLIAGRIIKFTFTNNTVVIKDGTNEEVQIKNLLGMSALNVVNRTTAKNIKNLKFGSATWIGNLQGSDTWQIEFGGGTEGYLEFTMVTELGEIKVKTKDKIVVPRASIVDFGLTNDKEVLMHLDNYAKSRTIQAVLDIALFTIYNESSLDFSNVTFLGDNWGDIPRGKHNGYFYFEPPLNGKLSFQVRITNRVITLSISVQLDKAENFEYRIHDMLEFYREDTGENVTIGSLLE